MKDIKGYEGLYSITSCGRVYSHRRKKFLKPYYNGSEYLRVELKGKQKTVHRLVAEAYIDNPKNLPEVNHKGLNKENNCINNLEWCDRQDNMCENSRSIGLMWSAIDFDNNTLTICNKVTRGMVDGKVTDVASDTLKSDTSNRTFLMNEDVRNYLASVRKQQEQYGTRPITPEKTSKHSRFEVFIFFWVLLPFTRFDIQTRNL